MGLNLFQGLLRILDDCSNFSIVHITELLNFYDSYVWRLSSYRDTSKSILFYSQICAREKNKKNPFLKLILYDYNITKWASYKGEDRHHFERERAGEFCVVEKIIAQ